jgi:hypothetical protein
VVITVSGTRSTSTITIPSASSSDSLTGVATVSHQHHSGITYNC